jgi:hypothetical protein
MNRCACAALVLNACVLVTAPAVQAQSSGCNPDVALRTYLERTCDKRAATIAAFDHVLRTWSVWRWKASGDKWTLEPSRRSSEKPEIVLRRNDELRTFVVNTNPTVFTADRTGSAEADIESLATLQQLALSVGSTVLTAATLAANRDLLAELRPSKAPVPLAKGQPDPLREALRLERDRREKPQELFAAYLEALPNVALPDLGKLKEAATQLGAIVKAVDGEALNGWLQSVESGVPTALRPPMPKPQSLRDVMAGFVRVREALEPINDFKLPCAESVGAMAGLVLLKRSPLVGFDAAARRDGYVETARDLATKPGCGGTLQEPTIALANWLVVNPPLPTGPTDSVEAEGLRLLSEGIHRYLEPGKEVAELAAKAQALADSEPKVIVSAARVQQYVDRANSGGPDPACGVIEIPRSRFKGSDVVWSKTRTDTVEVTLDKNLEGKLTLHHPESASGSFVVKRKFADGLAVDFAAIRTDLFSPSYEAKDLDGVEGGPSKVVETDRATRSGKVAIMAAYRIEYGSSGFALGPQVGAGIDTGDSAVFGGISASWRFLAIGVGYTWQKITALNGQYPGQILEPGDALKTTDRFSKRTPYVSLAISIKDLPFFKAKE